jgi:hypothetical protein
VASRRSAPSITASASDIEDIVDLGEEVEAAPRRRVGSMVAVRLSPDLLEAVEVYAQLNGLTLSDVLRQGAERVVAGTVELGAPIISGTLVVRASGQQPGLTSSGQGHSDQRTIDAPEFTLAG